MIPCSLKIILNSAFSESPDDGKNSAEAYDIWRQLMDVRRATMNADLG